jgi:hypothetical protein
MLELRSSANETAKRLTNRFGAILNRLAVFIEAIRYGDDCILHSGLAAYETGRTRTCRRVDMLQDITHICG